MKLNKTTYKWSLNHILKEGDTDLFPIPFEFSAIKSNWEKTVNELIKIDIENYSWKGYRKFIVPKGTLSFRKAVQLDPIDSLIITAIIKKYGSKIEEKRIPIEENIVYSYRFKPNKNGAFYDNSNSWHEFWESSLEKSKKYKYVVISDIVDFYNQIYHHVLENQLPSTMPKEVRQAIKNFLQSYSDGVSRGIPVGPHSTHLLAEASLITLDHSLLSDNYIFNRYIDDIHIFTHSKEEAEIALYDLVEKLDNQTLVIQKSKTKIVKSNEFQKIATNMLIDQPINKDEKRIIKMIGKVTNNNPYVNIKLTQLTDEDISLLKKEVLEELLSIYIKQKDINYQRLAWLLRRLTQVGTPEALEYIIKNIDVFTPILGEVGRYIMKSANNYLGDLKQLGKLLINVLEVPLVQHSEYLQMIIINIFSEIPDFNHIDKITSFFKKAQPSIKREIIRAAEKSHQGSWLRETKKDFESSDRWLRRSIVQSSHEFPGDEMEHWLNKKKKTFDGLEKIVGLGSIKGKKIKFGEIKLI